MMAIIDIDINDDVHHKCQGVGVAYLVGGQSFAFDQATGRAKSPPNCRDCVADVQASGFEKCCRRGRYEGIRLYAWRILQSL